MPKSSQKRRKTPCPVCGKPVSDQLVHLRLDHEIEDATQFAEELSKIELTKQRQVQFAKYVEELQEKKAKGLISAEDYRRLIMEWAREHE